MLSHWNVGNCNNPARVGGCRGGLCTRQEMAADRRERTQPRRVHTRISDVNLDRRARAICPWPYPFRPFQGATVVYLGLATMFAAAFNLVWVLVPGAFSNLPPAATGPGEFVTMLDNEPLQTRRALN